jgi:hypothetical protein
MKKIFILALCFFAVQDGQSQQETFKIRISKIWRPVTGDSSYFQRLDLGIVYDDTLNSNEFHLVAPDGCKISTVYSERIPNPGYFNSIRAEGDRRWRRLRTMESYKNFNRI